MEEMTPAIVVIGYDRIRSLKRLLRSIGEARYPDREIPLVISLDAGGGPGVAEAAEEFSWKYGEKRVIRREERLGLRTHVLSCGDFTEEFGSIIMLEDDLFVSPEFYSFASAALSFTAEDPGTGGVSLYNHRFNVFARLPFEPLDDGYDNWYFRFASSWGQAWTRDQWQGFRAWLAEHDGEDLHGEGMPSDAAEWGKSSWLKYAVRYLVDMEKFFLYPRISYTTNFFDAGEHVKTPVTDLQVPLRLGERREYLFSRPEESGACYDAYFENLLLPESADLYGLKLRDGQPLKKVYSTQVLPYRVTESFGLELRPLEANILFSVPGNRIFLYDLTEKAEGAKEEKGILEQYFYPGMNRKKILNLIKGQLGKGFRKK